MLWLSNEMPSTSCDILCVDGNKPSSCGDFAMCQSCNDPAIALQGPSVTPNVGGMGWSYSAEANSEDMDWLNTCGNYSDDSDTAFCRECDDGYCEYQCDIGAVECQSSCLRVENGDTVMQTTCGAQGYGNDCSEACGSNVDCFTPCNRSCEDGDEGCIGPHYPTTCGLYAQHLGDDATTSQCVTCGSTCDASKPAIKVAFMRGAPHLVPALLLMALWTSLVKMTPLFTARPQLSSLVSVGSLSVRGPQPSGNCGCEAQWQGAESYAQCARQGTEALGNHEAGLEGTWWVAGQLNKEDQFFKAGALMSLYLFGNMVYGNTNETAVFMEQALPT